MPEQHSGEFLYQSRKINVSYLTLKIRENFFFGGPGILIVITIHYYHISQIRDYAGEYPKEVIFVGISEIDDLGLLNKTFQELPGFLDLVYSRDMYTRSDLMDFTLSDVWALEKQVRVLFMMNDRFFLRLDIPNKNILSILLGYRST